MAWLGLAARLMAIPLLLPLMLVGGGAAAGVYTARKAEDKPLVAVPSISNVAKIGILIVAGSAAWFFLSRSRGGFRL